MTGSGTPMLLESMAWHDYELADSGDGLKLERFGPYALVRPEAQATWSPALPRESWTEANGIFRPTGEESGGHWDFRTKVAAKWEMSYPLAGPSESHLRFWAMTTPGRHLGVFPEAAAQWDFVIDALNSKSGEARVLNLFGYTGLASLACAAAGASVTHVDASKKSVTWAKENQVLSKMEDRPIRWILDDALKFALREVRRGAHYDGIIIEPPKFGRGPKGEVWEIYKSLPRLMQACRQLLSAHPIFMILTLYAVRASAVHLAQTLAEVTARFGGGMESGELVTRETSAGRLLSQAVFARWRAE
jgi:23S rRNA (cytosine1962-C5)-methyltransferase